MAFCPFSLGSILPCTVIVMNFKVFKTDGIWEFYLRDSSGSHAQCLTCKKVLKCAGGSTKGLHVHQDTAHNNNLLKRKANTVPAKDQSTPTSSSASPHSLHVVLSPVPKKSKITDYFHSATNSLPAILSRMTACDGLQFSVFVTSPDLRACIRAIGHELPKSAETIKQKVLQYASSLQEKIVQEIQNEKAAQKRFSLTFDEWTSVKNKRYININLHGNDTCWNLGLGRIHGSFAAERCVDTISSKLHEFGLSLDKDIVAVTTDGCSMMVKVGSIIAPDQQLCYAHGIQLAVLDVLYKNQQSTQKEQEPGSFSDKDNESDDDDDDDLELGEDDGLSFDQINITEIQDFSDSKLSIVIQKVRKVVKLFKRSPLKNEILHSHMMKGQELNLILDSKTRWNSLVHMLQRLVEVKFAVQKALIDVKANVTLLEDDFETMSNVILALKPLEVAVEVLCRIDANLITANATMKFVMEEMRKFSPSTFVGQLQDAIEQRICNERHIYTADILQYLHNPQERSKKKSEVKAFCLKLLTRLGFQYSTNNESLDTEKEVNYNPSKSNTARETVASRLQEAIASSLSIKQLAALNDLPSIITHELTVAEQSGKRGHFLNIVYKCLLTIPPTSVEAERVFSSAGYMCTKLRSSLSDLTLDRLGFLRSNLNLF